MPKRMNAPCRALLQTGLALRQKELLVTQTALRPSNKSSHLYRENQAFGELCLLTSFPATF